MTEQAKAQIADSIREFQLPTYSEIPNVGLYLEQTAKYVTECLEPLDEGPVTGSMISNYVKKGLIDNPVKKQYDRDQIAYVIFIAVAKSVLSMENIRALVTVQKQTYTAQRAYDYFRSEMANVMQYVFGIKDNLDVVGVDDTDEKNLLRNTIITVVHKVYLNKCFAHMSSAAE